MTPNLSLDYVSTSQAQKEVTINQGLMTLDAAVAGRLVKDLESAPDVLALSPAECTNAYLAFQGAPAQPVTLTVIARPWLWVIENGLTGTNAALTLKTPAGLGVNVTAGTKTVVFCNGTDVEFLGSVDEALSALQAVTLGRLVKDISTTGATTTLTDAEGQNAFLTLTGAPTVATTVVVPAAARFWIIDNQATGVNSAVSLKTPAGAAISAATGSVSGVFCDGVRLVAISDLSARVVALEALAGSSTSVVSRLVKDISGLGATVNLTTAEANNSILAFTGSTSGAVSIIVPAATREWVIENKTTAARLTVKTPAGTGVVLSQLGQGGSYTVKAYCDGANVQPMASNQISCHVHFQGKPAADQIVFGYVSKGKTLLSATDASTLRFGIGPAASPGFTLYKAPAGTVLPGSVVGGFQLQAGNSYKTFAPTADVTLADGDFLYLRATATPDANLSDIFGTLNFTRLD